MRNVDIVAQKALAAYEAVVRSTPEDMTADDRRRVRAARDVYYDALKAREAARG